MDAHKTFLPQSPIFAFSPLLFHYFFPFLFFPQPFGTQFGESVMVLPNISDTVFFSLLVEFDVASITAIEDEEEEEEGRGAPGTKQGLLLLLPDSILFRGGGGGGGGGGPFVAPRLIGMSNSQRPEGWKKEEESLMNAGSTNKKMIR